MVSSENFREKIRNFRKIRNAKILRKTAKIWRQNSAKFLLKNTKSKKNAKCLRIFIKKTKFRDYKTHFPPKFSRKNIFTKYYKFREKVYEIQTKIFAFFRETFHSLKTLVANECAERMNRMMNEWMSWGDCIV